MLKKYSGFSVGQITLPVVLLIGGIVIEIAIAAAFVNYFLSGGGLGARLAERAESAAHAGIRDGMIRITRNKDVCIPDCSYTMNIVSDAADVYILRDATDPNQQIYIYTITAIGKAMNRQKKLQATVIVSQITGRVQFQSIIEQPVS